MKKQYLYKFLRTGLKSESGTCTWEINKWQQVNTIKICEAGFHGSLKPLDALSYVKGEIIALAEVKGESAIEDNKQCWSDMRLVKTYEWTKNDSIALAVYSAELVVHNYIDWAKKNNIDPAPVTNAIETAKKILRGELIGQAARSAADSAAFSARSAAFSAADSAFSAADSAFSAAFSAAYSAFSAADSAAFSAAFSARSAADSADSAGSAAKQEIETKINNWIKERIKF